MKVLIVEDEFDSRRLLRKLLELEYPTFIFLEAVSVEEAVVVIKEDEPKLLFCDIELKNERSFDIFRQSDVSGFELIFITAHAEFALKAFEFKAINYILKPINRKKLYQAVNDAMKRIQLLSNTKHTENEEVIQFNKLILPGGNTSRVINVEDILFCQADGSYCKVYLNGGVKELVVKPLIFLEKKLKEHQHFFRTHKSYLVNLSKVTGITSDKSTITINREYEIPVGRSRKVQLNHVLEQFFF